MKSVLSLAGVSDVDARSSRTHHASMIVVAQSVPLVDHLRNLALREALIFAGATRSTEELGFTYGLEIPRW